MSKKSELDQLTPEIYLQQLKAKIEAGEESADALNQIHVCVERVMFSEKGERLSFPQINVHSVSAWGYATDKGMQDYYKRLGYDIKVLYDPRGVKEGIKTANAISPDMADGAEEDANDMADGTMEGVENKSKRGRKVKGE